MRKIERDARAAFFGEYNWKRSGNGATEVVVASDVVKLLLHGNVIAEHMRDGTDVVWITDAGWDTVTTRSRLRNVVGANVYREKGQLMYNGAQWNGQWIAHVR